MDVAVSTGAKDIFIRSTVLPGTCQQMALEYGIATHSMPEFLSEKTAKDDYEFNDVVTGCQNRDLLDIMFEGQKEFIISTNREAEYGKYVHNAFAAMKVWFFNDAHSFCEASTDMDYKNVRRIALESGYINRQHTMVPGHDGMLGFGGKCLPKDLKAFAHKTENKVLTLISKENAIIRKEAVPASPEESDCCGGGCS